MQGLLWGEPELAIHTLIHTCMHAKLKVPGIIHNQVHALPYFTVYLKRMRIKDSDLAFWHVQS